MENFFMWCTLHYITSVLGWGVLFGVCVLNLMRVCVDMELDGVCTHSPTTRVLYPQFIASGYIVYWCVVCGVSLYPRRE